MITIPLWIFVLLVLYSLIMVIWNTYVFAKALTELQDARSFIAWRFVMFFKHLKNKPK